MKITIELGVDQEAYDRKYGPGTKWWAKYESGPAYEGGSKPASDYSFAPDKAKDMWDKILRDVLTEGLYDWTQLYDEALKINIKFD